MKVITETIKPLANQESGVAAVVSTRLPAEALYQFKNLFADGIISRMVSTIEDGVPTSGVSALARELKKPFEGKLDDLRTSDCVLVVGADLQNKHQVAGFFIKRNRSNGTKLIVIDPQKNDLEQFADIVIKPGKDKTTETIKSLIAALGGKVANAELGKAVEMLKNARKPVIICGKTVTAELETVRALYELSGKISANARLLSIKGKANSLAAAQYGMEKEFTPGGYKVVYVALGDEKPTQRLLEKLANKKFLAVQASYSSTLTALADVILPVAEWVEQPGHYLNADGHLQESKKAITQPDEVRDNVEVLKDLADRLGIKTTLRLWDERSNLPRCHPVSASAALIVTDGTAASDRRCPLSLALCAGAYWRGLRPSIGRSTRAAFGPEAPGSIRRRRRPGFHQPPGLSAGAATGTRPVHSHV